MCKFEFFSQKHTFHFHGFIRFFHLRHNHLGAPSWIMPSGFRALGKLLRHRMAVRARAETG